MKKHGKALTWDDLAKEYDKVNGRGARTYPMDTIFEWAERRKDFFVHPKEGTIHKII